jgi:hypothetical protein
MMLLDDELALCDAQATYALVPYVSDFLSVIV